MWCASGGIGERFGADTPTVKRMLRTVRCDPVILRDWLLRTTRIEASYAFPSS